MIWVLAALAFLLPFVWRYVVVTGSVALSVLLVAGGIVWFGSLAYIMLSIFV